MSTKENRTLNPDGGRYPFKVSDDYFDHLTARIMEQIPTETPEEMSEPRPTLYIPKDKDVAETKKNRRRNLWIGSISIAASLILIATIALKFIPMPSSISSDPTEERTAEYTEEDYNEALMTYTMVDNMDIYCYLSSEDYGE